ncbi:complex I NDUFA9 subunit family protein [Sphingobium sp. EP60837]|uniref:complex I NDUFA9 subunit family protein n=1 Tax=Sphingobium sp. EP60837 TaxID=1855519 RepID=UPI0007DDD2D7|nr:complex I NDUFA9 subunit family protein [Sphingobium sp. EP60837]ANI77688.1 NADH:ubiquinone reductase (H(+)-translocating) [Sphingobium sp. EP60837]
MERVMKNSLVTVFGGGGFLGRQVAQALMERGARVRVAQRDLAGAMRVQPLGALGQKQFVAADIRKPQSVARAIAGSDIVINLVGVLSGDLEGSHHDGAANVAKAAAEAGVQALVHVSAIGADPQSPSEYGRSKAAGEAAVKAAFPQATIIRPSIIFGPEDQFLNRLADLISRLPVVPVIGADTKFQPVYVADVAQAIANAAANPGLHGGKTFELGGPRQISMIDLNRWIAKAIGRDRSLVAVPPSIASTIASFGWLPGAPITRDQYAMLQRDNVVTAGAAGLTELGVSPTPMEAVAENWLVRYRRHGRFAGRAKV